MRESSKVWQPSESRIEEANITQFIEHINRQGNTIENFADLHQWSLDHVEKFWQESGYSATSLVLKERP